MSAEIVPPPARGRRRPLQILTAGDDVEDEDIGDAEASDDWEPWTLPADDSSKGPYST